MAVHAICVLISNVSDQLSVTKNKASQRDITGLWLVSINSNNIYGRLKSMSSLLLTFNPQIHVRFPRHRHLYLRSMSFFQILKSMADSQFFKSTSTMSLIYPLTLVTLTNKSAIDLRILKGCRFENIPLNWTVI